VGKKSKHVAEDNTPPVATEPAAAAPAQSAVAEPAAVVLPIQARVSKTGRVAIMVDGVEHFDRATYKVQMPDYFQKKAGQLFKLKGATLKGHCADEAAAVAYCEKTFGCTPDRWVRDQSDGSLTWSPPPS
jgi:hypothetical protein